MNSKELFNSVFEGKDVERPPLWFMRQAGRYLPEYLSLREGKTFEQMVMDPNIASEITLQPIRRFDLDAAIIFSDILIPLYSMERGLEIKPGVGPVIEKPLALPEEVDELYHPVPKKDYPYLSQSIAQVRATIPEKWLIGFSGAPFTLASYLIEGKSTRNALTTKVFAYKYPDAFAKLLDKLVSIVLQQLKAQIGAGVDMVQIFDSWAGFLSPTQYRDWILPSLHRIMEEIEVPKIIYARGSSHLLAVLDTCNLMDLALTIQSRCKLQGKSWVIIRFFKEISILQFSKPLLDWLGKISNNFLGKLTIRATFSIWLKGLTRIQG
ncbi:MAG: uroporphyrinogen decarboxylase [Methanobacteriota archaeon]|nr:MAG: uroporphyrinogen decarboxylase [Euryarchaeota archaeon]